MKSILCNYREALRESIACNMIQIGVFEAAERDEIYFIYKKLCLTLSRTYSREAQCYY